ncbi:hypothetical protein [Nitrosopumilus sp.]|uniref:hypothetical protein n=1 Tax=Nitrosopumilus sp. TaxID=2024843 RepID=UPI003D0CCA14
MQKTLVPYITPAFKQSKSTLSNVADYVDDFKFLTNWKTVNYQGWHFPSIAPPHYWCSIWNTDACTNIEGHNASGFGKRAYVKQYQRSCYRASCQICYLKWIARESDNAKQRIEYYGNSKNHKPIHVIFSVHPLQAQTPIKILRQRLAHILKIAKFEGGAVVFHPFARDKKTGMWYPKPHFHFVGFGSEQKIKQAFGKYRWYVKIKEERKSVFQTFCYLLSHCGIRQHSQSVTWYGNLSYSKMPRQKSEKITVCPLCGHDFEKIVHYSVHPVAPPYRTYFGLVDFKDLELALAENPDSLQHA